MDQNMGSKVSKEMFINDFQEWLCWATATKVVYLIPRTCEPSNYSFSECKYVTNGSCSEVRAP